MSPVAMMLQNKQHATGRQAILHVGLQMSPVAMKNKQKATDSQAILHVRYRIRKGSVQVVLLGSAIMNPMSYVCAANGCSVVVSSSILSAYAVASG